MCVAVGRVYAIETARAVNQLTTDEGELLDSIDKPIGQGRAPRHQLKPLIAVPTTAGTGSESTAMCVLDVLSMRVKTGISHWRLRPTLAVIDPLVSLTMPPEVTASAGMDIVCHALESYTARWYSTFDRKQPEQRVTYCGSNPVSDLWCEKALTLLAASFRAAFREGSDLEARSNMMLAATFAGMGFGNSGVHIPHANAYPIAGMVKDFRPAGYPQQEPMVPHGMSVSLTAPEAFRFSFPSQPERHLKAAALLAPDIDLPFIWGPQFSPDGQLVSFSGANGGGAPLPTSFSPLDRLLGHSTPAQILSLGTGLAAGAFSYLAAARFLHLEEVEVIAGLLRRPSR